MQLLRNQVKVGYAVLLLLVAIGLSACSEDPNPVGAGLLPSSDFLKLDTASTVAIRSYSQPAIPATSTTRLLVGAVDDIESWSVLRFPTLDDSIRGKNILTAELILRTTYHYGDSLAAFALTAHKVLRDWGTDSLTIDTLNAPGFYNSNPIGSVSLPLLGDTASISISIDTTLIREWGTTSDTTKQNLGMLLKPASTGVVKGFAGFGVSAQDQKPKLLLRFMRVQPSSIETLIVSTGGARFCAHMGNTSWSTDSTHIYVQNGIAYRGILEFNVDSIPARAAIHKATLELAIDPSQSRLNSYTADSTFVFFIDDNGVTQTSVYSISETADLGTVHIHRLPVGQIVQRWVRGAKQNKVAIAGYGESNFLDLFAFHGAAAPQNLKPKLTIIYSLIR